ncbi:MAG: hypothetical protein U5R31_16745 [Acidimicrobiia bacterium]|nr:hypothetical protein [Acidimicrobiia bacterium]
MSVSPSSEGMPGADLVQQLLNWGQMVALWGSLGALLVGAAMYGLAREGGSYGGASGARPSRRVVWWGRSAGPARATAVNMLFQAAKPMSDGSGDPRRAAIAIGAARGGGDGRGGRGYGVRRAARPGRARRARRCGPAAPGRRRPPAAGRSVRSDRGRRAVSLVTRGERPRRRLPTPRRRSAGCTSPTRRSGPRSPRSPRPPLRRRLAVGGRSPTSRWPATGSASRRAGVWWLVRPLAWRVETFSPSGATVAVWRAVTVLSAQEVAAPQAEWVTVTIDLAWVEGDWRVDAVRDTAGPTPQTGPNDQPWDAVPFDEALEGFTRIDGEPLR